MLVWLKENLDIMEAVVSNAMADAADLMRTHPVKATRHREQDPLPRKG